MPTRDLKRIFKHQSYVIKKKANYMEKLLCGVVTFDNVYKLSIWDENQVEVGKRLIKYKQDS